MPADADSILGRLTAEVDSLGFSVFGAFHPAPDDQVPLLRRRGKGRKREADNKEDREAAGTLVLIGNAGPSLWSAFVDARTAADPPLDPQHPLDDWTRRTLGALAARWDADIAYPFGGPPYHPIMRWAKRAGAFTNSPLGMMIHPDHGLWLAFRAALLLRDRLDLPPCDDRPSPCDSCSDQPCLNTCPVDAFAGGALGAPAYNVAVCRSHLKQAGGADCRDLGCRARCACPVAADRRWPAAQAALHMAAFSRA